MKDKITKKISDIEDSVRLVKDNLPENFDEFLDMDKLERDGIYKNIEFSIQNILDICAILLKEKNLKVPASDEDMLNELKKAKILSPGILNIIHQMRGFRNYLVHRYGDLDDETAFDDIKKGINDFSKVLNAARKALK